jgi:hypothetical protein
MARLNLNQYRVLHDWMGSQIIWRPEPGTLKYKWYHVHKVMCGKPNSTQGQLKLYDAKDYRCVGSITLYMFETLKADLDGNFILEVEIDYDWFPILRAMFDSINKK